MSTVKSQTTSIHPYSPQGQCFPTYTLDKIFIYFFSFRDGVLLCSQAGFEFSSSCHIFPSAGIIGMSLHAWPKLGFASFLNLVFTEIRPLGHKGFSCEFPLEVICSFIHKLCHLGATMLLAWWLIFIIWESYCSDV
jgi:hypothetical protein